MTPNSCPGDIIIFTVGSVVRDQQSGWASSTKVVDGQIDCHGRPNGMNTMLSSIMTENISVTLALTWVSKQDYSPIMFVTYSLYIFLQVRQGCLHTERSLLIKNSRIRRISQIYFPGHAERQRGSRQACW